MRRRPWPIVILAIIQIFIEPFSNLFLNSRLSHMSAGAYFAHYWAGHEWISLFYVFMLPPVMGLSAYAMKKWTYAIFVAGASWMVINDFHLVIQGIIPMHYALGIYLANLTFVVYFLLPRVNAPYMNPRMRWWESKTRFLVDWPCRAIAAGEQSGTGCRIQDFSVGGVFIATESGLNASETLELRFSTPSSEIIAVRAKPVFKRPLQNGLGYGLQFIEMDKNLNSRLSLLAKSLVKSNVPRRNGTDSSWHAFKEWAERLLKTGQGLVPEFQAPSVTPPKKDPAIARKSPPHDPSGAQAG